MTCIIPTIPTVEFFKTKLPFVTNCDKEKYPPGEERDHLIHFIYDPTNGLNTGL